MLSKWHIRGPLEEQCISGSFCVEEEEQASSKSLLMNEGTENSPTEEDILVLKKHLLDIKYIEF